MQSHDCGEGDWVDAQLVSRPSTTRGHAIQWQCFIRNHMGAEMWADYPPADNATIEHSFVWDHKKNVELTQNGGQWVIDLKDLQQISAGEKPTHRPIRRIVIVNDGSEKQ